MNSLGRHLFAFPTLLLLGVLHVDATHQYDL